MTFYTDPHKIKRILLDLTSNCIHNVNESTKADIYHNLIDDYVPLVQKGMYDIKDAAKVICTKLNEINFK